MAIFKCKMCGGTLDVQQGAEITTCEYCGTMQTLPKLDSEKKQRLYDRAESFRRNQEFDKAADVYLQIINENDTDADSYWAIVLCRYGIEYVEDPISHKQIPTVNRVQFTPVVADEDYKTALRYATEAQRKIYEKEAAEIDQLQKDILTISKQEEPFDVFICYKETDHHGRRTPDSVLATELYHELLEEGFKVFFSRITLEDKIGIAYEPYIFAALHSAKVMVVLGTRKEYFEAPWVKNEWARYLALIKNGEKKILIPAYRDMDPYDLPEEFSNLQAQDMDKLGFMQDLIRGIKKVAKTMEPEGNTQDHLDKKETVRVEMLLERINIFLEDEEWENADAYCERVLDQDPKNGKAYLGKLLAELHLHKLEELSACEEEYTTCKAYERVMRFGDKALVATLNEYKLQQIYADGVFLFENAESEKEYEMAVECFQSIPGYKDADRLCIACQKKKEDLRKDAIYKEALRYMNGNDIGLNLIKRLDTAESLFLKILDWKEANELAAKCRNKKEQLLKEQRLIQEQMQKKEQECIERWNKRLRIIIPIGITLLIGIVIWNMGSKWFRYQEAIEKIEEHQYEAAGKILESLDGFKDSESLLQETEAMVQQEKQRKFMTPEMQNDWKVSDLNQANVGDLIEFGHYEQDNDTSNGKEKIRWKVMKTYGNYLYVVSEQCLDCQPYHENGKNVDWSVSTLREWLQNDFYETAFSKKEKEMLVRIRKPDYDFNTSLGKTVATAKSTADIVSLLSIDEIESFYKIDRIGQCQPTNYAQQQGCTVKNTNNYCNWWTKTREKHSSGMAVEQQQEFHVFSNTENAKKLGIRPTVIIDRS